jgi:hypothetical protein
MAATACPAAKSTPQALNVLRYLYGNAQTE